MTKVSERIWVWGGVVSIAFFVIGWVGLEQFLPPLSPTDSAPTIAHIFASRHNGIRLGAIFMMFGSMLWLPWAAVVSAQIRQVRGKHSINAWIQFGAAATACALILLGEMFWVVAAFRPERDPNLTQLLSDLGFISQIMPFMVFFVWNIALSLAIFEDKSATPAYPRWAAYFGVWMAILYIPGCLLAFFQTGPLAWNGLIAFYLPAVAFFIWLLVMTVLAIKSVNRPDPIESVDIRVPSTPVLQEASL